MNTIREISAAILFIIAILLTIYICINRFSWPVLFLAIITYLAAYWIWPSKRNGQRDDNHWWLDLLEIFIELPFRIIGWLFRALKNTDAPDIDL